MAHTTADWTLRDGPCLLAPLTVVAWRSSMSVSAHGNGVSVRDAAVVCLHRGSAGDGSAISGSGAVTLPLTLGRTRHI